MLQLPDATSVASPAFSKPVKCLSSTCQTTLLFLCTEHQERGGSTAPDARGELKQEPD